MRFTKEQYNTLVKIEHLIGYKQKELFGKDGDRCVITDDGEYLTKGDFIDYMDIIETILRESNYFVNN